jgi:hypothetical protein
MGGTLHIRGADSIQHVVNYKTASIGGVFVYGNDEGEQLMISATGSTSLKFHKFNELWIQVLSGGDEVARKGFRPHTPLKIRFEVSETKSRAVVDDQEIVGRRKTPQSAGQFSLHGGNGGLSVSSLVITGIPEESWVKEFLGE